MDSRSASATTLPLSSSTSSLTASTRRPTRVNMASSFPSAPERVIGRSTYEEHPPTSYFEEASREGTRQERHRSLSGLERAILSTKTLPTIPSESATIRSTRVPQAAPSREPSRTPNQASNDHIQSPQLASIHPDSLRIEHVPVLPTDRIIRLVSQSGDNLVVLPATAARSIKSLGSDGVNRNRADSNANVELTADVNNREDHSKPATAGSDIDHEDVFSVGELGDQVIDNAPSSTLPHAPLADNGFAERAGDGDEVFRASARTMSSAVTKISELSRAQGELHELAGILKAKNRALSLRERDLLDRERRLRVHEVGADASVEDERMKEMEDRQVELEKELMEYDKNVAVLAKENRRLLASAREMGEANRHLREQVSTLKLEVSSKDARIAELQKLVRQLREGIGRNQGASRRPTVKPVPDAAKLKPAVKTVIKVVERHVAEPRPIHNEGVSSETSR
ncbi:hypothetical protein M427DRAFT_268293 [Gonapodya prolifera JEL478]|uniref:Uncharacterized protein n=1 Tax=Gonapodya prolifera (strain JEL478) TaxID=1344416 RepID=A0A139AJI0_GONPJ|nr:hypothetical protein M427DRAFT_268293 [Gonapodya prolifera JEL478]|eukprot:KXS16960.1 hypothetical protein M427DRAFT_268293 [Gonapodya prolifera JEL478]